MTFEEKGVWLYLAVAVVIPAFYFPYMVSQMAETPVEDISWVGPMIAATIASVVATTIVTIIIASFNPAEAGKSDQRDKEINRFGDYFGGIALSVAVAGVLILTMFEPDHFWIAHAIYIAFLIQAITASIVKLVAYRRGF